MRAAWTKSAKMDKYFCIAILFSFAVAINASLFNGLLEGSGDTCAGTGECTETNEVCFETDNNQCWCPAGFTGDDCTEPNTDFIDERCRPPTLPDYPCSTKGVNYCSRGCSDGTICCSVGCVIACVDLPEKTCTTTANCSANNVCSQDESVKVCRCPLGYTGDDCMERQDGIDDRCPLPDNLIDVCVASQVDNQCSEDNPCPDGEICCPGANGCSTNCIPIGCKDPVDHKTCTDQNKICIDDDSTAGFDCKCPFGYSGAMCATRIAGFDEKCPFPEVPGDTCNEIETPTCTKADDCEDDKVCCSTGCGTACVDLSDPKPKGKKPKLPVAPVGCPPKRCVCSKNLGAICKPNKRGCGANIRDQHTGKRITQYCKCDPWYQIYSPCSKNKCFDVNGNALVCPGHPNARCRVTQCGRCQAYWIDIHTGKQVKCKRGQPDAACGPGEIPVLGCPDVCQHIKCSNYPYATCRVRACNGCTAKYTYLGRDVTSDCHQVVG
uniref:neurogenic locus notch homolog protein 2-like isoform X3 n=1 Tax=Styela clava TaxID=7725 RepID=UPI00193A24C9|nr:neurogenic locus notch homolog protein 2-like isoform X3 [Styela clava]